MTKNLCFTILVALLSAFGLRADTSETIAFLATMLPANETPPITDASIANAIISFHLVRDSSGVITSGTVDFDIATTFSGAVTVTGLHIHNGPAGTAGPNVIPTDVNSTDKSIAIGANGKATIAKPVQFPQTAPAVAVSTIQDLVSNPQNYYVNIHTTDHPGGAMRGQLIRAQSTTLMALMSPQNETPPVASNASGVATVTALRGLDSNGNVVVAEAIFNLEYTGFDPGTVFTGFHIYNGAAGVAGPVIINTGIGAGTASVNADPSGAGNLLYQVAMTPADRNFSDEVNTVNGLFSNPNNHYINIHTTVFPSGVMRDQLRNTDRGVFQVNMLPSNEVPPITGLTANAITDIPIDTLRNADGSVAAATVVFDVNFRGFPPNTTFTGLHIHNAPAGTNGAIVIPTSVNSGTNSVSTGSGNGNIFKRVTVATSTGIAAVNQIVQDPSQFYANIHTTVNPGGAMRSQLAAPASKPAAGGVAATSSTVLNAAPGSILSVYGTTLAAFASNLDGFSGIRSLPTSLNGVTVTINGVKTPLYYVGPGQIDLQVPFEVSSGTQTLVATSAGGTSTLNVPVASLAPSIFIVDQANNLGAVVKNTDFSLVTATNRVKAGDTIVIYSTGLGQTTPAVQTGTAVQPPAGGFNNTGSVSVTIDGQDAGFVYSIASPGFAGLYQTAVTVPSGVSGNVQLVLKAGSASSNTVTLAVQ